MRSIQMVFAIAVAVPGLAIAQSAPGADWPVASGSRIRILSPVLGEKMQTATAVSASTDTLVFLLPRHSAGQALTTAAITKMDVSTGTRSHKAKGAMIGFAVGAAAGAILGYATYKRPRCQSQSFGCIQIDFGPGGDAAFAAGLGGVLGLLVGTIAGTHKTDTWVPVRMPGA